MTLIETPWPSRAAMAAAALSWAGRGTPRIPAERARIRPALAVGRGVRRNRPVSWQVLGRDGQYSEAIRAQALVFLRQLLDVRVIHGL